MLRRDPLGYITQLSREYGDLVEFRLLHRRAFLFNHPDYVRDILVTRQANFTKSPILQRAKRLLGEGLLTSEGEHHLRERRLVQPAFHRDRLASYAAIMTAYSLEARERWRENVELDMHQEMMRLTLEIVVKALFASEIEDDAQKVGSAMTELIQLLGFTMLPFANLLDRLPLPRQRRFERARAVVNQIVGRIIHERRAAEENSPSDNGDLLSTLLAVRDEDGSSLSGEQLRDEILTLFVAGHETTALALTWTWYLLAHNPECERQLHREIDTALEGRAPGFDDLPNLPYTEKVLAESLRLYPPAWALARLAKQPFELNGITIPQGAICLMSPYVMHRDPRFFEEPGTFDPERWRPDLRDARPKFSYFPFGGGARVCIAERFAWTEMILAVATLAQKWRFRLASKQPVGAKPTLTLRPSGPVRMLASAR